MKQVVFNVGFSCPNKGSSVFTFFPISWRVDFKTFAELQRRQENIEELFQFAQQHHVPAECIILCVRIEDGDLCWEYVIKMINVREYRAHWEQYKNAVNAE